VDVAGLISDADRMRIELEELGRERMETLDPSFIPQIKTTSTPLS
jgi:hypothetical protein